MSHSIRDILAQMPIAELLGIEPLMMGEELTLRLPYQEHLIGNPMRAALHGGAVGGFMEIAAITELTRQLTSAADVRLAKPIGVNIDFLQKGRAKDCFARASIQRQGSRVANVRVRAWQDNYMQPISMLHGHFLMPRPSALAENKK